jgi:hypothetical protein
MPGGTYTVQHVNLEMYSWKFQYKRNLISKSIDTSNKSDIHTSLTSCYTAHLLTSFGSSACRRTVYCTVYICSGPKLCFSRTMMYFWTNKSTTDLWKAVALARLVAWGFHRGTTLLLHFIKSVNHCSPAHRFMSHDLG